MSSDIARSHPAVLVTGGAARIGRAIVEDLAAHDFAVAIHANRSTEKAHSLADKINADGGHAIALTADLTQPSAARQLVPDAAAALGRPISLLVNNASVFEPDAMGALDDATWQTHFALHAHAPVLIADAMAAALPANQPGLVVNMIDQRVWKLTPRFMSYTLSKSTLWTATQTMAQALAPAIRVNAIGAGPALKNTRQSDADFAAQVGAVPLQRGPELSEFGATIRYLWQTASITGQMIALDGGQHLAWETPDVVGAE